MENDTHFFIETKYYNGKFKFLYLNIFEIYEDNYIIEQAHKQLDISEEPLHFETARGSYINASILPQVLMQYRSCAEFLLVISGKTTSKHLNGSLQVNSEALEKHLRQRDCAFLFKEYQQNGTLSDASRRMLVNEAVNLLRIECSNFPCKNEKLAMAAAITTLFPSFKSADGQDIFFNPATNKGYLVSRLKNLNHKRRKLDGTNIVVVDPEPIVRETTTLNQEDLEFFRNCVLPEQRQSLEERLKKL